MGISAGPADDDSGEAISEINVVPLTDVMLVLLIIFLIAIPVVLETVPVQLPKIAYEATETKPENVTLSVNADPATGQCQVYWLMQPVTSQELTDRAVKHLEDQIAAVGGTANLTEENMPEVHIRSDINTPYRCVGGAVFTMQRSGFARVGFISEPPIGTAVERL
jgi:biopolymer transport protein ExbD